ncbi:MAG: DUF6165 family protein [Gammaproteobacteria bacterium]
MSVKIDVSYGELIDKITILEIKSARITEVRKLENIERELTILTEAWRNSGVDQGAVGAERAALKTINENLWDIEDRIRRKEAEQLFDQGFIELARSVYRTNDERSIVKRAINDRFGSSLVEEKSYQSY